MLLFALRASLEPESFHPNLGKLMTCTVERKLLDFSDGSFSLGRIDKQRDRTSSIAEVREEARC